MPICHTPYNYTFGTITKSDVTFIKDDGKSLEGPMGSLFMKRLYNLKTNRPFNCRFISEDDIGDRLTFANGSFSYDGAIGKLLSNVSNHLMIQILDHFFLKIIKFNQKKKKENGFVFEITCTT